MAFTLNKNDRELLTLIAEYRLLTVSQIAALIRRNDRSVRRRLRGLANEHLIEVFTRSFGSGRGRPEGLVSLAWRGIDVLRKDGVLRGDLADDRIKTLKAHYVDHQLLVNWFRIHLVELERVVPQLLVRFLAPTSPFLDRGPDDWPLISERVTLGGTPAFAVGTDDRGAGSEVDLGLFARGAFHPAEGQRAVLAKSCHEPPDTVILRPKAVFADQVLVDPLRGQPLVELAFDDLTEGLALTRLVGGAGARGRLGHPVGGRRRGQADAAEPARPGRRLGGWF